MDRMKTFLIYALIVVGFILLSNFLIDVSLNSQYKDIERKDQTSQVQIYQAEATLVNGRIRGVVTNSGDVDLNNKYIKIDFYSKRDVFLGRKYIQINQLQKDETQPLEVFFKLQDVKSYSIEIVDEKPPEEEIEILPNDLSKSEVIISTALVLLILW